MKFTFKKQSINGVFQIIVDIAQKNASNDTVKNVLVSADKDTKKVIFRATNFDIFYEASIEADILEHGDLCINAHHFFNIVREIPYDTITVESNEQKWMKLYSGKSFNKLPGIDNSIFPTVLFESLPNRFNMVWKNWNDVVGMIYFGIGDNPARKNLMGLNIKSDGEGDVRLTSSDAFRMLSSTVKITDKTGDAPNLIVPKKSIAEFRKLNIDENEDILFSWDDRIFQIESETVKMKTSLIGAKYPELSKLLFSDGLHKAVFNAEKMQNLLRILKIYVSEMNLVAKITFKESRIIIEGEKNEVGETIQELDCIYDDKEINIGLNVNFLMEALQVFGNEEIEAVFNHPDKPLLLRSKKHPNYHSIIMPIRLQW